MPSRAVGSLLSMLLVLGALLGSGCGEDDAAPLPPRLSLSSTSVSFSAIESGPSPASQLVVVSNAGAGALAWTAAESPACPWLHLTGTAGGSGDAVTLSAVTGSLVAGTYRATVEISDPNASNTPQTVDVTFTVQSRPIISPDQTTITFMAVEGEGNPAEKVVTVTDANAGANPIALAWTAAEVPDASWLALTDASGASGDAVTLSAVTGSLVAGTYSATVEISDPNASNTPQTVDVTFVVWSRPVIGLDRTTVGFTATEGGADPAAGTVVVTDANTNASPIPLSWAAAESPDVGWLTLAGTSGANGDSVTLSAATGSLPAGTYNATVEISDPNASNAPQTVDVTLVVEGPDPAIGLDRTGISFEAIEGEGDPAPQTVTITDANLGGSIVPLSWTAAEIPDEMWLALSGASGAHGDAVVLSAATGLLVAGTYNATVEISDPNASNTPQTVVVTFVVRSRAVIDPDRVVVAFNVEQNRAGPGPELVTVNDGNAGANAIALSWKAAESPDEGWLTVTDAYGGDGDAFSLIATTASLAAGSYSTSVEITDSAASNSPVTVAVDLVVTPYDPKPAFSLSTGLLSFEALADAAGPASQQVELTNGGDDGTTLDWSVTSDSLWLSVNQTSGTTSAETDALAVSVDIAGLTPGAYSGTLTFDDAIATNSPFYLDVQLRVVKVWFVDIDAPAGGDGLSWATAFNHPQDAADAASDGDEVWVAEGTYVRREATDGIVFNMPWNRRISVYGSFTGTESWRDERDVAAHETVLDGQGLCTRVVGASGDAVFDGFTVMRGAGVGYGGGIWISSASVTVSNCIFKWNSAAMGGGLAHTGTNPTVRSVISNCVFMENSASDYGGGLTANFGVRGRPWPKIVDCIFIMNTAGHGGGMSVMSDASPPVTNCLFVGNSASTGGAIYTWDAAEPIITNCTFAGNRASGAGGGAIHKDGWWCKVENCILWGNVAAAAPDLYLTGPFSSISVGYSCIEQGGYNWVRGRVRDDPLFVDPGYWDDNGTPADTSDDFWVNGDYRLRPGSPCIDAANGNAAPATDTGGSARHDDPGTPDTGRGAVTFADLGVYEFRGDSELLGHWKLDDGADAVAADSSGNERHGTLTNMDPTADWVAGQVGGALDFDGIDNCVDLTGRSVAVQGNGARSVSAWVKAAASGDLAVVSTGTGSPGDAFDVLLVNGIVGVTDQGTDFFPATGATVNDGFWHHIAAVYDGAGALTTHVDGVLDNTASRSYDTLGQDNFIGRSNRAGFECWFDGTIDDVRIYRRSLSAADVYFLTSSTPLVDAGGDLEIALPMTAALDGMALDDGLPDPPGSLTVTWEKVSGPGGAVFFDEHAANTTAGFSEPGAYVLRLTADDGQNVASDEVAVLVRAYGYPIARILASDGSASEEGPDSGTFAISREGDTALPLDVDYTVGGTASADDYAETLTGTATIPAGEVSVDVVITPVGDGELEGAEDLQLTLAPGAIYVVDPLACNAAVSILDAGLPAGLIGWWKLDETSGTIARDMIGTCGGRLCGDPQWTGAAGGKIGGALHFDGDDYVDAGTIPAMTLVNNFTWAFWARQDGDGGGIYNVILGNRYGGSPGTSFIKFTPTRFEYVPQSQQGIDYVDVPADTWIHHTVVKKGTSLTYYRDGVPGGTAIVSGTMDSNPFFFGGDSGGEQWQGTIDDVRIYDRALSADEVHFLSSSVPLVEAGDDQTIYVPAYTAALAGSAVDDGLPEPATLIVAWEKASGPGTVNFSAPNSAITDATFGSTGVYVLRLTAYDTRDTASDEVTVTVWDMSLPTVSIAAADADAAEEGQDAGTFTVTRSIVDSSSLTVLYSVAGNAEGADYVEALSGSVTIDPDQPSADIVITPVDDGADEGTETITLALGTSADYNVDTAGDTATVAVLDNDVVLANGLVAHWCFDETEGTTALDSAGNGYDGTLTNMAGDEWVAGKKGGALSFDGSDDYVDAPDGFADFTGGFTIAVWAYPTAASKWSRLIDFGNSNDTDNILLARADTTNDIRFAVYDGSAGNQWIVANDVLELNEWNHFAATIDASGNAVVYKNGAQVATGATGVPGVVTRTRNYIGESNWAADEFYQGLMDDIRIYNRALSLSEIQLLAAM